MVMDKQGLEEFERVLVLLFGVDKSSVENESEAILSIVMPAPVA